FTIRPPHSLYPLSLHDALPIYKEFPIQSQEMNQKLGAHLLKNSTGYTVDVHDPDVIIKVEIRVEATYITSSVIEGAGGLPVKTADRKSTRLNSSHVSISYAVFC